MNRKTLSFCAQRLAVSNTRLDEAYYTLTLLKDSGEPVPVDAVNTIIVGCAIRCALEDGQERMYSGASTAARGGCRCFW